MLKFNLLELDICLGLGFEAWCLDPIPSHQSNKFQSLSSYKPVSELSVFSCQHSSSGVNQDFLFPGPGYELHTLSYAPMIWT